MSGNGDDDKAETGKVVPLDLASKVTTVKAVDGKAPLLIPGSIRGAPLRVLAQPASAGGQSAVGGTILTTSIVPQAVLKQGVLSTAQAQSQGTSTIQRSAQITLAAQVVTQNPSSGTTFHVPRGPAVVANIAAPRSNVATAIRAPMIVPTQTAGQPTAFVRPPRTPSPAQGTAWLTTNSSNGSQIKGAPTVLSSPVRGATVTGVGNVGKQQIVARSQPSQNMSTIKPAILHSAITIGQGGQIHPFKPGQPTTGIQVGSAVTLTQVLPSRSQTLVYSTGNNAHFATAPRLTVANSVQTQRHVSAPRSVGQVTTARLSMPVTVAQTGTTRLVTPQATVLASNARLSAIPTSQPTVIGTTPTRIVSTAQQSVSIGRLPVTVASASPANTPNILSQTKISIHPLLVANSSQTRTIQTQGAKVVTQPTQGPTIHLASIPAAIKSSQNVVTTTTRTINVQPATIVAQRQGTVVSSQTIPIAKVFPSQEGQQPVAQNLYIHPVASVPRRGSPGPANVTQATTSATTTTVATYSLASGAYFYDATGTYSVARTFNQQATSFASLPQSSAQQIRPAALAAPVHSLVTNPSMRFNPIMVVEPTRNQQFSQQQESMQEQSSQQINPTPTKMTSSPRPSILRKRDHEGSPLKASKNLAPVLANLVQQPPPISPPPRPDSRGNGHSSGGSTTISATSSPGLAEANEDSLPHAPVNIKEEEENRPPIEMSPRKKPRKQQLTGNDIIDEPNDEMQFLSDNVKKEEPDSDGNQSDGPKDGAPEANRISQVRKPASALLINSYRHNWKTTHNHYLRYSDVRPKEERRPTIIDLANQHRVLDKINGWKIHHLSTQMDDLADQEQTVYNQLNELLKYMESMEEQNMDKDVNRINELIKGNLQRIKIINDGMVEAKGNIMKVFDHKVHISDIINRCASKRNFKKREKS